MLGRRLLSVTIALTVMAALFFSFTPVVLGDNVARTLDNPNQGANYTVSNNTKGVSGSLVLTLVICFGLVVWGMREGEYHWMFLAGFLWIAAAIVTLIDYGLFWMLAGLAIGITVIIEGATNLGMRGGE